MDCIKWVKQTALAQGREGWNHARLRGSLAPREMVTLGEPSRWTEQPERNGKALAGKGCRRLWRMGRWIEAETAPTSSGVVLTGWVELVGNAMMQGHTRWWRLWEDRETCPRRTPSLCLDLLKSLPRTGAWWLASDQEADHSLVQPIIGPSPWIRDLQWALLLEGGRRDGQYRVSASWTNTRMINGMSQAQDLVRPRH